MKKILKKVILMVILLGVCSLCTGVYAVEKDNTQDQNNVVTSSENINNKETVNTVSAVNSNQTETTQSSATPVVESNNKGIGLIGASLATGLACIGAGIAVAVVASSAIGAISENPNLFGKTIIFAGLAEGIAIYGLIISIMILSKF